MTQTPDRGFLPVLSNPSFRSLWGAQWLALVAQNAINFIQLVLIEQLTGSTIHIGITVVAFTLPGVIFSPLAGVVADRFPKKWVMVASNSSRVLVALGYVVVLTAVKGPWRLVPIYVLTFLMSTLSQFFAPAEAAMIPLLVGEKRLIAANALFSITIVLSQMIGLVFLGPIMARLLRPGGAFIAISLMYLGAAILVGLLPSDRNQLRPRQAAPSPWHQMWVEFREGLSFIGTQPAIKAAITQLVTIMTLVMIMAMLMPGYAARVLGMSAEDVVVVFAPAGVGMLIATGLVGRWGHGLRRIGFDYIGLFVAGLAFIVMGGLSLGYPKWPHPLLSIFPRVDISLTTATILLVTVIGMCVAAANILAQTTVQQDSPAFIRGRVLSVQFMLTNLAGILPMLALGVLADLIGIPRVLQIVGIGTILIMALSFALAGPSSRPAWLSRRDSGGQTGADLT
jgi:MFS family permease